MPPSHLLARWIKTAKSQFKQIYTSGDNIVTWSRAVREHAFARLVYYIRHEAVSDPEAFDVVKEDLEKLIVVLQALRKKGCTESTRRKVIEIEEQPNVLAGDNFIIIGDELDNIAVDRLRGRSGILATLSSQACPLLDPYVVKTKGRTAKRIKGPLEKPHKPYPTGLIEHAMLALQGLGFRKKNEVAKSTDSDYGTIFCGFAMLVVIKTDSDYDVLFVVAFARFLSSLIQILGIKKWSSQGGGCFTATMV
ncbi:hypothetical protein ACLOJK_019538 [Asimina triloba]